MSLSSGGVFSPRQKDIAPNIRDLVALILYDGDQTADLVRTILTQRLPHIMIAQGEKKTMKFQFISEVSNALGLAMRLKEDGHTIFFLNNSQAGQGFFEKKKEISDINILDGVNVLTPDHPKIGGSKATNTLLTSREYMQAVLATVNIPLLDEAIFTSEGIYPGGNNASPVKSDNSEVVIEAYFNGDCFLKPPYIILDCLLKKIDPDSRLYQESLLKLEEPLRGMDYKGPIALRLLLDEKEFVVLGFERRFRYQLFETLKKKLSDFFSELALSKLKSLNFSSDWIIEVPVVTLVRKNIPIEGITKENKRHIWLRDVYRQDNGILSAGQDGLVLFITSYGRTPNEARRRSYRTFSNLTIPYARVSFVDDLKVERAYKSLKEWGWIE